MSPLTPKTLALKAPFELLKRYQTLSLGRKTAMSHPTYIAKKVRSQHSVASDFFTTICFLVYGWTDDGEGMSPVVPNSRTENAPLPLFKRYQTFELGRKTAISLFPSPS